MITKSKSLALMRTLLAAGFLFAGVMHFVKPEPFLEIVPGWLPEHLLLVYVSGIAEIAGAIGLLFDKTRRLASLGLILLLVAVFPANINMAMNAAKFPGIPETVLWLRLPVQFLLMFLVWLTRNPDQQPAK